MWRSPSSKREEEQHLTSSGDGHTSSGATATTAAATAAAASADDAPFLAPIPPGPFLRTDTSWDRGEQFRSPKQGLSGLFRSIVTTARPDQGDLYSGRGRASTSARPLDERRKQLSVLNFFGLKRRSSIGGGGGASPAMSNELRTGGRGAGAWDAETEPWDVPGANYEDLEESLMFSDAKDSAGRNTAVFERSASKLRVVKWADDAAKEDAITRAVTFLEDALGYRDPDYNSDPGSIRSYRLRQSRTWRYCTAMAVVSYIAACFLGKPPFSADWEGMPRPSGMQQRMAQTWGLCLECGCVLFFAFDIYLLCRCTSVRSVVMCWWKAAFVMSLFFSVVDVTTRWYTLRPWSRVFRPAVFFFVGPKVRDCAISTLRGVGALLPVLLLELLVTLVYSCVCVVLYHGVKEAPFTTLEDAFLSLFALSTTVNDPDVWMPLYDRNRANVLVFISFLVVQVFLLHNILLAAVWNEFGERMKVFAKKKRKWREESVRRAFGALDVSGLGYLPRDMVMTLLMKIRPHYDGSKRLMLYERIVVQSAGRRREGKIYDAADVTQVYRRDFCNNVVEALSLKIRTMREQKIARMGQLMLLPLYVWNMAFVVVSCAMSPWVFNTNLFWWALLPTSILVGASILAELVITGVRAYIALPWNRVKTMSLILTIVGLLWFAIFTSPGDWGSVYSYGEEKDGKARNVHIQVAIALLMSSRCMDLGTLLKLVPSINGVVSTMYMITPSVFAQAGVIFTIFHVYAYLGMALYGGVVTRDADYGGTPFANSPYYFDNNFNSYPEGLVTLFELLVVNNWNMLITGYVYASPLGMWAYMYFISFITLAVTLALNVLTAIFMTAFTATTVKANMANRGGGSISQSMTSSVARTALGAGASLALRPSSVQYLGHLETEGPGLLPSSPPARRRATEPDVVLDSSVTRARGDNLGHGGDDASHGGDGNTKGNSSSSGGGSGNSTKSKSSKQNRNNTEPKKSGGSRGSAAAAAAAPGPEAGAKMRAEAIPPPAPAKDASLPARFSDPLRLRLSATAVLPEHEEVCKVGDQVPDMRDMRQDSYLGWGSGVGDSGMPPLPPSGGGGAERARRGSGHYYKVSRRNSYSDRDMFEAGMGDGETDVAGMVLGAIAIGLGNSVGIRACMLRPKEVRTRNTNVAGSRAGDGGESSDENELEQPDSHLMFENSGFRQMVAAHLPVQFRGVVLDTKEEGWEAMAMRDELTDEMLHNAFGEAIYQECPPCAQSPGPASSRSGFPAAPAGGKVGSSPPSPVKKGAAYARAASGEDDMEEEADSDLPKDLGIRMWSKTFTREEKANKPAHKWKPAILSIQCVLAVRRPVPVVVYTARTLQ